MSNTTVTVAFAIAGALAGPLLALISLRLPEAGAAPRPHAPIRYAAFALAGAGIGCWAALSQMTVSAALLTAVLGWLLLLIAVVDAEHFWLPDQLTLPLGAAGIGAAILPNGTGLLNAAIGAAVGFAALWLLAFAYRRLRGRDGLGGGDPFLLAAGGAWVGWMGLPSVLLWAAASGLSLVAARLLLKTPLRGDDRLAFGVFLAIGIWMTWIFGPLGVGR
ncbi:prepilin peptidase [Brevundimonas sp. GCM10030266]|uniref:prepilin peptidase n=1 Tax=Brevundimonas sp. GCM10030266 TaxID=3273386 RepID=UPI0036192880